MIIRSIYAVIYSHLNIGGVEAKMKQWGLIFSALMMLCLSVGCGQGKREFDGSRTSHDTRFLVDYDFFDGEKSHRMKIEAGETINVEVKSKSGKINLSIEDSQGNRVYKGLDIPTGDFQVAIDKTDTYEFKIVGEESKGSMSIKVPRVQIPTELQDVIDNNKKESIKIHGSIEKTEVYDSKFGGEPYYPKEGIPYPTSKDGQPLKLLAQINFAQLPANTIYPENGLLQFYINPQDDVWDCY